jgi:hypothetical protein
MNGPSGGRCPSQYCRASLAGAAWNLGGAGSWLVLTHCWALRDQTSSELLSRTAHSLVWGGVAGVGMDLVNWIVDASICDSPSPGVVTF